MKKFLTLFLLFLGLSIVSSARTIVIKKINGGKDGYGMIKEEHAGKSLFGLSKNRSMLICLDSGLLKGEWNTDPYSFEDMKVPKSNMKVRYEDLIDFAEEMIARGIKSGTFSFKQDILGDRWKKTINWESDTLSNRVYTIDLDVLEGE